MYKELFDFLSIPSISVPSVYWSNNIQEVAQWLKEHLSHTKKLKSKIIETIYDPLIYAEYVHHKDAYTLLFYSHADVQPADKTKWNTDPFVPVIKNGKIFCRGVSDSKGHLFAYIEGIKRAIKNKNITTNVKFIIDCDEEASQVSLPAFLKSRESKKLLKADGIVIAAGSMIDKNTPSICYGYRGILALEIKVKTLKQNLHSGSFGGVFQNAAEYLSKILSDMRDHETDKILIQKFYENVAHYKDPVPGVVLDCCRDQISRSSRDLREWGSCISSIVNDSLRSRLCARPTFEIHSIVCSTDAEKLQYVVVSEASAKISFRLVMNQDPKEISQKVMSFLSDEEKKYGIKIDVTELDSAVPVIVNKENTYLGEKLRETLKKVTKKDAVWYLEGGCVPVVDDFIKRKVSNEIFMVGFGSPDDNIHGPNERLSVKDFEKEIDFAEALVSSL